MRERCDERWHLFFISSSSTGSFIRADTFLQNTSGSVGWAWLGGPSQLW